MDSGQTQAARQTAPIPILPAQFGSNFAEPDLDELVPAPGIPTSAAEKVLEVRRYIMDRVYSRREVLGRLRRHRAEAMECKARLESNEEFTPWQIEELHGRMEQAIARMAYAREKARQYELEIETWYAKLVG